MFRFVVFFLMSINATISSAGTVNTLDLLLRVDSVGYSDATIFLSFDDWDNENGLHYDFLDVRDDVWGISMR